MKKIFRKRNIKYYLLYYFFIEVVSKFQLFRGICRYILGFLNVVIESPSLVVIGRAFLILLVMLCLWLASAMMLTLPVTIFLLAKKSADISHEIKNKKYTSQENLLYYREKFENISPTTISLMQNLELELEKDLTATLLKLQLAGKIEIEDDKIKMISETNDGLDESEIFILNALKNKNFGYRQKDAWKKVALVQAQSQGLIENTSKEKTWLRNILLVLALAFFILLYQRSSHLFLDAFDQMTLIEGIEKMTIFEVAYSEDFHLLFSVAFYGLLFLFSVVGMFGWPIFVLVYVVRYKMKAHRLRRTKKGEKLTDEILGMKRFIHEFSTLDEASKNELLVWDDFLVYAVILEENIEIVDDMFAFKKMKRIDTSMII